MWPATSWSNDTFLTVTERQSGHVGELGGHAVLVAVLDRLRRRAVPPALRRERGLDGQRPGLTGVTEMLLGLLVMSQSPIFVAAAAAAGGGRRGRVRGATRRQRGGEASALISPRERVRRMRGSSFRVRGGRVAWGHGGRRGGWSQGPPPRWTPDRYPRGSGTALRWPDERSGEPDSGRSSHTIRPPHGRAVRRPRRPARPLRRRPLGRHLDHLLHLPRAGREHVRRLRRPGRLGDPQRRGARPGDRRARAAPPARPARRQRAGGELGAGRHLLRQRDPADRRPQRQARLRLVDLRARHGPLRVRLLRPARPQGAPRLRGRRPRELDGDQQLRARPGRGRRRTAAGAGRSATRRRCRRTSRSSTPGPSTSCGPRAAATTSACSAGSRSSSSSSATPRSCSTSPSAASSSSASASASRSRRSATTRCSCPTWAARWRTGAR